MTQNASYKHHFIPKFYVDNFTNTDGKFYIYLVKEDRFKMVDRLFTPKSSFFTEYGNTVRFNPNLPDYLETDHYSPHDSDISPIFRKIRDSEDLRSNFTSLEMVQMNYFFSHLYWRNPLRDNDAKKLLNEKTLEELGFVFKGSEDEIKKAELLFRSSPDFYKIVKWMLPLGLHHLNITLNFETEIIELEKLHSGKLLSDNPIIYRKEENIDSYSEEMFVPLTANMYFTRTKVKNVYFDENMKAISDLIMLKQANEYVSVTDMGYIDRLKTLDSTFNLSIRDLKELLFYGLYKNNHYSK